MVSSVDPSPPPKGNYMEAEGTISEREEKNHHPVTIFLERQLKGAFTL